MTNHQNIVLCISDFRVHCLGSTPKTLHNPNEIQASGGRNPPRGGISVIFAIFFDLHGIMLKLANFHEIS